MVNTCKGKQSSRKGDGLVRNRWGQHGQTAVARLVKRPSSIWLTAVVRVADGRLTSHEKPGRRAGVRSDP